MGWINWFKGLRWRALSRLFALAASMFSLLVYWYHPSLLDTLDERSRDVVFRLRQSPPPPPEVVVVAIDEKSIKSYGRWPWPRALQAELIAKLKQLDVNVIALDIIYLRPQSPEQDAVLRQAIAEPGPPVIGGYFFRAEQTIGGSDRALALLHHYKIGVLLQEAGGRMDTVPAYPYVETNQSELAVHMDGLGFFNYQWEPDGLLRRAPLILAFDGNYYPSLPLITLARFFGQELAIDFSMEGVDGVKVGGLRIPVDSSGRMALNFYDKKPGITFYSAADILEPGMIENRVDVRRLKGKIVFVGVTEIGVSDMRPTPVDPMFPGVAVHATVAANIIQGFHLYRDQRTVLIEVVLIALVPLILVWAMARLRRPLFQTMVFGITLSLLWALYYWLVAKQGLLISLLYPVLAATIGFIAFQAYYVLVAQRHTRFLKHAFSSYVSPALVNRLIERPEELSLMGEQREISVLFSDIRGFTTLSESLSPEQLVSIMNKYLGPMTDIVMQEQGTLDKYIGDAMMVIFNAPLDVKNHARCAATCALRMLRELPRLNVMFESDYGIRLAIGIGIHSGEAVVGNMGSARRFDYTAMGDTVNLASRLEGQTKAYGVAIIISEAMQSELNSEYTCRRLDKVRVKGKAEPVVIYELLDGRSGDDVQRIVQDFEAALEEYFQGNFQQALEQFQRFRQDHPQDGPAQIFIQRCQSYLQSPPPADWQGVHIAIEK